MTGGHNLSLGGDPRGGVVPFTNSPDTSTTDIELIRPGLRKIKGYVRFFRQIQTADYHTQFVLAKFSRNRINFILYYCDELFKISLE